jgi:hypothetical protein
MARKSKPAASTFGPPGDGDLDLIRHMIGKLHVSTSDAAIETMIRDKIVAAAKRQNKTPENGDGTVKLWVAAALDVHKKNRELFVAVCTGDFDEPAKPTPPINPHAEFGCRHTPDTLFKQFREQGYYLARENFVWWPTDAFRNAANGWLYVYQGETYTAEQWFVYLKDCWRPADREGQDYYCCMVAAGKLI